MATGIKVANYDHGDGNLAGILLYAERASGGSAHVGLSAVVQSGANSADFVIQARNAGNTQEKLRILATGQVGINDTSPDAMLDLLAKSASTAGARIEAASAQTANLFEIDANTGTTGALVVVDADGDVGIGDATPDAQLDVVASGTTDPGLIVEAFSGNSTTAMEIHYDGVTLMEFYAKSNQNQIDIGQSERDHGNDRIGPSVRIYRHNGTGAEGDSPGTLLLMEADGNEAYLYHDNNGLLRTNQARPTGDTGTPTIDITAGAIVGDQSSRRSKKNVYGQTLEPGQALLAILSTPVWEFDFKDERYNGERFQGVVIEDETPGQEQPWYSKDKGRSLNETSLFGHLIQGMKAQQALIVDLMGQVQELRHSSKN